MCIIMDFNSHRSGIVSSIMRAQRDGWHGHNRNSEELVQKAQEQEDYVGSRDTEGEVLACLQPNWGW